MAVSVIIPTRMRTKSLARSVASVLESARFDVEVLLALDDDDVETAEHLETEPIPNSRILVGPRVGYGRLHLYVNALARIATGDWLFLWNDDCIMETRDWDSVVSEYNGQMVVLNPQSNHSNQERGQCVFPIVPRRMVEILGHFSLSNHNDTYVEHIANRLGIRHDVPIHVLHDRADLTGNNDDDVFRERVFTTSEFFGPEIQRLIVEDCEKLRPHLDASWSRQ